MSLDMAIHRIPGRAQIVVAIAATWFAVVGVAPRFAAAEPPAAAKQENSVDDALLEDLDNELLEGLGPIKDAPAKKAAGNDEMPVGDPGKEPTGDLIDGEDLGEPSPERDPLGHISREMRQVEELIPRQGKQAHAEQLQQRIVEDLAQLIEQAEQQRASQQSSKNSQQRQTAKRQSVQQPKSSAAQSPGKNSNQPASDSTNRLGQAEAARPEAELFQGLLKDAWGHLPEREREQMLQTSRERFLPRYELLIERYYRRLAEERTK